jgi:NitT/TauT family transport system ATP-binding protein
VLDAPAVKPATTSGAGVTVRDVSMVLGTRRRVHVLDNISFEVPCSRFCCLIGVSGCGKTTLLNLLAGFLQPTRGEVLLGGAPPGKARSAVVFQEYALFPWLTAAANVELGLESRGADEGKHDEALRYLEMVGLRDFAHSHPHELSGGMQQRVAIARALACAPDFLLMDEPLGALDALSREQVKKLIARLWSEFKQTVVYVTHDVGEAVYLADQVVVLSPHPGRLKAIVPIDLPRPRRPTGARFVELVAELTEMIVGRNGMETDEEGSSHA